MEDQGRGKGAYVPAEYSHGYSEDIDVIRDREYPLLKGMPLILISLYPGACLAYPGLCRYDLSGPCGYYVISQVVDRVLLPRSYGESLRESSFDVALVSAFYAPY